MRQIFIIVSMLEHNAVFSDVKFKPPNQTINPASSFSQLNLDKYDSMLDKKLPLKTKIELMQRQSFEKFVRSGDGGNKGTVRISLSKLTNATRPIMPPLATTREILTERPIATGRDFSVRRRSKGRLTYVAQTGEKSQSQINSSLVDLSKPQPGQLQSNNRGENSVASKMHQSMLLPDRSEKVRMASSLVKLKQVMEDFGKETAVLDAQQMKTLINSFEELLDKDSYYSTVMKSLVDFLRRGIFVSPETRSHEINDILQLNNKEVNAIMFTEAGEGKLTHYECSQKILKAFLRWTEAANKRIAELEHDLKSRIY